MFGAKSHEKAYLAPFVAFFAAMGLGGLVETVYGGHPGWAYNHSVYWVVPLQTLVCSAVLIHYWRFYELRAPRRILFTTGIGILALVIWVAPQEWLGSAHRLDGFDPGFFGLSGWPYELNVAVRLVRLVIVVPLLEEIFWRGFLLRYLINEDFTKVPIGAFSWLSFGLVTAGFCLEHSKADWPAAILTGVLFNLVAYRTKSLASCVLVHAVTNAALGAYVLQTRQWGFW